MAGQGARPRPSTLLSAVFLAVLSGDHFSSLSVHRFRRSTCSDHKRGPVVEIPRKGSRISNWARQSRLGHRTASPHYPHRRIPRKAWRICAHRNSATVSRAVNSHDQLCRRQKPSSGLTSAISKADRSGPRRHPSRPQKSRRRWAAGRWVGGSPPAARRQVEPILTKRPRITGALISGRHHGPARVADRSTASGGPTGRFLRYIGVGHAEMISDAASPTTRWWST